MHPITKARAWSPEFNEPQASRVTVWLDTFLFKNDKNQVNFS